MTPAQKQGGRHQIQKRVETKRRRKVAVKQALHTPQSPTPRTIQAGHLVEEASRIKPVAIDRTKIQNDQPSDRHDRRDPLQPARYPAFHTKDLRSRHGKLNLKIVLVAFDGSFHTLPMLVVHVHVHVKPECVEDFKTATLENAKASLREPGIARFDFAQQQDDPTRFVLVEIYRADDAPAKHKETAHYQKWRDSVATMMAEPRSSVKYTNVSPL
jgi:autoinducer 2-degrading protein